jgi:hypothetical protein
LEVTSAALEVRVKQTKAASGSRMAFIGVRVAFC